MTNHGHSGSTPHLHAFHNTSSGFYHHPHHITNQNPTNAGYSSPQTENQNSLNGNESPNSVTDFPTNNNNANNNNNNIQLPETPNSMVTIMGPTSGNSNSNEGANVAVENKFTENITSTSPNHNNNNNNSDSYNPWSATTHHLNSGSSIHPSSYNTAGSFYNSHHNFPSSLMQHQNISGFAHPHANKNFGMSQPFYSWY
jgi:hypothetical protein